VALPLLIFSGYFLEDYEPTITDYYRKQLAVDDTEVLVEVRPQEEEGEN
jgi:hypothetical protein